MPFPVLQYTFGWSLHISFYYVYACRSLCGYVHVSTSVGGGQQRVLDPMKLELQVLVSWVLERNSGSL